MVVVVIKRVIRLYVKGRRSYFVNYERRRVFKVIGEVRFMERCYLGFIREGNCFRIWVTRD